MAKILDDFYGKNLFRGGTIASNHDFFSKPSSCLLCRKRTEMSSQSYFEKSILVNMLFLFQSIKSPKTLFLYFGRNEIVYILVYKILFSNIFLSNLSKIALKIMARMMMHTCRKNSLD